MQNIMKVMFWGDIITKWSACTECTFYWLLYRIPILTFKACNGYDSKYETIRNDNVDLYVY